MKTSEKDWKSRFERLKMLLISLGDQAESEIGVFKPSTERPFLRSRRIYVSFDMDICDTKKRADEIYGEDHYDVYDLNHNLSPFDKESEGQYEEER